MNCFGGHTRYFAHSFCRPACRCSKRNAQIILLKQRYHTVYCGCLTRTGTARQNENGIADRFHDRLLLQALIADPVLHFRLFDQEIQAVRVGEMIGQLAPSIVMGSALGAAGAPAALVRGANAASILSSSYGNAYKQAMDEGYDVGKAKTYGTLVGLSEALLETLYLVLYCLNRRSSLFDLLDVFVIEHNL